MGSGRRPAHLSIRFHRDIVACDTPGPQRKTGPLPSIDGSWLSTQDRFHGDREEFGPITKGGGLGREWDAARIRAHVLSRIENADLG